VGAILG
jgi:hypothetical protein